MNVPPIAYGAQRARKKDTVTEDSTLGNISESRSPVEVWALSISG